MTTRVLIINRQLVFAVTIKQALEQTGAFEVHPFTAADAALEYLRTHPHEVALVDFSLPGMPGAELVRRLRALQPEIAVIVSPSQSNGAVLIRELKLQGIIDAPFSARSIIPLIEHAVEQIEQPQSAITRNLPDEDASGATEVLGGAAESEEQPPTPPAPKRRKPAQPAQPRILETRHFEPPPPQPGQTRVFDRKPSEPPPAKPETTRNFDQPPDEPSQPRTRILDENELPPSSPVTRQLDDKPPIKPLSVQKPPDLPEFSSLDEVLADEAPSEIYEPPVAEGDTPPVPAVDSDAVRQFLATQAPGSTNTFGDLLGKMDPQEKPPAREQSSSFNNLVNSMRVEQQHRPLPDRQQQFIDFILTGGMDVLLTEIEKHMTGPLTDPSSVSDKLAEEEPPMPTLEESGTVGDLMLGVSDTSFRNVLAIMQGDEDAVVDEVENERQRLTRDMEEAFAAFFDQQIAPPPDHVAPFIEPPPARPPEDDSGAIPAQLILETTENDSTPVESFSLNALINSIEHQLSEHTPNIQSPPSWTEKIELRPKAGEERYIKEPDFLPEEGYTSQMVPVETAQPPVETAPDEVFPIPEPENEAPVVLPEWDDLAQEWDAQEQQSDSAEFIDDWGDVTVLGDVVEDEEYELPPAPQPAHPSLPHDFFMQVEETPDEPTIILEPEPEDVTPVFELPVYEPVYEAPPQQPEPLLLANEQGEDPYIAQIALSLTQVSLELTAEATLLSRDQELVASAGTLTREDIEEFSAAIGGDWSGDGDEARIRFVRLASSGKDYMLYSRRTAGDFTLSMIFAASTPLRDIRRQGERLMEALETVPEMPPLPPPTLPEIDEEPQPVLPPPAAPESLTPYVYVWLPDDGLSPALARTIETGLHMQLREQGWQIQKLIVESDYVYVLADVPGERPAHEIVRDLKRRAVDIARAQNPDAMPSWTDGYLVMTPGRDLDAEEIEQFIRFERL